MATAEGASSSATLDETSANLIHKMQKVATGEETAIFEMDYSSDDDLEGDSEDDRTVVTRCDESDAKTESAKPTSYASAASFSANQGFFRPPLNHTIVCNLQLRVSMGEILREIENNNLDDELEGIQIIRGGTVLEVVMKSDRAKNVFLEKGLNIGGFHHIFHNSTPNRTPTRRTTVSILGLPLEAKNYQVGKVLQEMGYGKHLSTRPVIKLTPTKGTPYYSGILVAVMEDLPTPIPYFLTIRGYRVRAIHTGQPARLPRREVQEVAAVGETHEGEKVKETKVTARTVAEETIEKELKTTVEESVDEQRIAKRTEKERTSETMEKNVENVEMTIVEERSTKKKKRKTKETKDKDGPKRMSKDRAEEDKHG